MTRVRCTRKLLRELRVTPDAAAAGDPSPGWHANLVVIERHRCMLFTHDRTLFSFVVFSPKRPTLEYFSELFAQGLFKALLRFGFSQGQVERMLHEISEIRFAKADNRRVLGSMTDMKRLIETFIAHAGGLVDADLDDIERRINETPFKAIDYDHPVRRLRLLMASAVGRRSGIPDAGAFRR
jgi:hypothetical protein